MVIVIDRNINMQEKYILIWYSRTIFNNLSDNYKNNFRKLEVNSIKLISTKLHLEFNLIYYTIFQVYALCFVE